jgi:2-iminobutanoate/2-iminopropanoate deaminase
MQSAKRRRITVPDVQEPPPGYWSNCFVIDKLVVIAGMIARDRDNAIVGPGDPLAQSIAAFERMKLFVEAAGGKMGDIVKLTAYMTDIRHRIPFTEARKKFFSGDFPPCTVVGGVVFAHPEYLVEIEALAVLGSGG